jgi:hypothetical protein
MAGHRSETPIVEDSPGLGMTLNYRIPISIEWGLRLLLLMFFVARGNCFALLAGWFLSPCIAPGRG